MAANHQNPYVSIIIGVSVGLYNSIITVGYNPVGAELFKVVVYGIIGGAMGYIGKQLVIFSIKIHKTFFSNKKQK